MSRICVRGAARVLDQPHADVDAVDARDLRGEHGLDRIRQVVVQPRLGVAGVLAEAQHRAELVRLDLEEAREAPHQQRGDHDQQDAAAAEIAARQHAFQLVLAAAQQFLEVGRRRPGRLRSLAPRPLGASRAPRAAALITPWHENLSGPANPSGSRRCPGRGYMGRVRGFQRRRAAAAQRRGGALIGRGLAGFLHIGDEIERRIVIRPRRMGFARAFVPNRRVNRRETARRPAGSHGSA